MNKFAVYNYGGVHYAICDGITTINFTNPEDARKEARAIWGLNAVEVVPAAVAPEIKAVMRSPKAVAAQPVKAQKSEGPSQKEVERRRLESLGEAELLRLKAKLEAELAELKRRGANVEGRIGALSLGTPAKTQSVSQTDLDKQCGTHRPPVIEHKGSALVLNSKRK